MQTKHRGRRPAPIITVILLVLIGGGLLFVHWMDQREEAQEALYAAENDVAVPVEKILTWNGQDYRYRHDIETYLLIGLDKFTETRSDPDSFLNNQQADFLFLMIVDNTNRTFSALHINRDTMAKIYRYGLGGVRLNSYTGQLALAHTYGSGGRDSAQHTVDAVAMFLHDLPIDHYAALTMDAIPVLNDLVGGVEVFVEDDFSAADPTIEMGKTIRLKGKQALTFVRARFSMSDPTNTARMRRQRVYLDGLYTQLSEKLHTVDGFALRLASRLADFGESDITTDEMAALAERLKDFRFNKIYTIAGEARRGEEFMEFYADEDALLAQIIELFYEPLPEK